MKTRQGIFPPQRVVWGKTASLAEQVPQGWRDCECRCAPVSPWVGFHRDPFPHPSWAPGYRAGQGDVSLCPAREQQLQGFGFGSPCFRLEAAAGWGEMERPGETPFLNLPQLLQNCRSHVLPPRGACCARALWCGTHLSALLALLIPSVTSPLSLFPAVTWNAMASSSDSDDDGFMAVDPEDAVVEGTMEQEDEPHAELEPEEPRHNRSMLELPEEVLEYILSFLSPYQEHKTAALVCKQWYRLIKGTSDGSAFL